MRATPFAFSTASDWNANCRTDEPHSRARFIQRHQLTQVDAAAVPSAIKRWRNGSVDGHQHRHCHDADRHRHSPRSNTHRRAHRSRCSNEVTISMESVCRRSDPWSWQSNLRIQCTCEIWSSQWRGRWTRTGRVPSTSWPNYLYAAHTEAREGSFTAQSELNQEQNGTLDSRCPERESADASISSGGGGNTKMRCNGCDCGGPSDCATLKTRAK